MTIRISLAALCLVVMGGCVHVPEGVTVVSHFDAKAYTGVWYEIARLDHRFERGLSNVSATYSLRPDGAIDVLNRGYHRSNDTWKEADGVARLAGEPHEGRLKVSFFGPFYASYNILVLDAQSHALVCGPDRSYLWILSRTRTMPDELQNDLIGKARQWDFPTEELIIVEHDRQDPALESP